MSLEKFGGVARIGLHEAIEHLQQEDVQSLELVPDEALGAEPRPHLIHRRQVLGRRVGVVLHVGERGLDLRDVDAACVVRIAARHVAGLTRFRIRPGAEVGLELAVQPLEIRHLFERVAERLLVHHRQIDRVAAAAHPRVLDVGVVLRFEPERRLHRMCRDGLVLERSADHASRAERELAGDRMRQEVLQRVLPGRRAGGRDAMTRGAAHAVARERAVFEPLVRRVRRRQPRQIEVRLIAARLRIGGIVAVVDVQLPLPHHAVTPEAGVDRRSGNPRGDP